MAKQFVIYPSVGRYVDLVGKNEFPSIDGKTFYNPSSIYQSKLLSTSALLLRKVTEELSISSQLSQEELDRIDNVFNDVNKMIEKLDIGKKIGTYFLGVHTFDRKVLFNFIWSFISKGLKEHFGDNLKEGTLERFVIDSVEQAVLVSIDIILIKKEVETAYLQKYFPKLFSKAFGRILGIYDGALSASRLINAVTGSVQVAKNQMENAKNTLPLLFLIDYAMKFESDINLMALDIYNKTEKYPESFWGVWYHYMKDNLIYSDISDKLGNPDLYEAAQKSIQFIEKYGNGGMFNGQLTQHIDIDDKEVIKSYSGVGLKVNKLYYMPKISSIDMGFDLGSGYFRGDYKEEDLNFILYFDVPSFQELEDITDVNKNYFYKKVNDNRLEYLYAREAKNARFRLKVSSGIGGTYKALKNETREIIVDNFFVPGFLDDMSTKNWAMPYIAKLFNAGIISGYDDGTFRPKTNVSVGQFLLMSTKALLYKKYKNKIDTSKEINNITFTNYAEFLHSLGIDIDYSSIKNYSSGSMDKDASRGYIAKVLTSMFTYREGGINYKKLDGDWDSYSDFLSKECISSGKDDLSRPGYKKFAPNDAITRDEVAVMISKAMDVSDGTKLSCMPRKKY